MTIATTIRHAVMRCIPGTTENIAMQKRAMERALRADGWSRAAAKIETQKRFNGRT